MTNIETKISLETDRLKHLKSDDNWHDVRNEDKFEEVVRTYSFGKRLCLMPKNEFQSNYQDLQSSRSINIKENDTLESMLTKIDMSLSLEESDILRIKEIEDRDDIDFSFDKKGFVELGFRTPLLLNYYKNKYNAKTWGYDIVPLSIYAAKKLNFDGRFYDFNDCDQDLDLSGASLVVSYHMLEHTSDPLVAIQKIFQSMDSGAFFHVEIPIESGRPRLQFGHLFAFQNFDLSRMLDQVGFKILSFSHSTHTGGPEIERYLVTKP
jgi:hypothetical protein